MITLIHGEDTARARNHFLALITDYQKKGFEIAHETMSDSLFADRVLFTLENPKVFPKSSVGKEVIILCDGKANVTLLKSLPKEVKIQKFDLPKKLFSFIDNMKLNSFHEVLKTEPIQLIFALIGRQFRDIYWAKVDPKTLDYQPWRLTNLQNQGKKMDISKLKRLIAEMAEIDRKTKIGEVDLLTSLDLLIASELE